MLRQVPHFIFINETPLWYMNSKQTDINLVVVDGFYFPF
jgi:hypothetical protein